MSHGHASAAIVIMLRELKTHGIAHAVAELASPITWIWTLLAFREPPQWASRNPA